jgi:ribosomal protein S18 acetylase RimI-like enzyme
MWTIHLDADFRDFLIWRQGSGNTVEIYDIAVGSERRKGRGRALVNKLYEQVPTGTKLVWAITRSDNFIAQEFYEELQFRVVGILRNFYQDSGKTVDAILYGRDMFNVR